MVFVVERYLPGLLRSDLLRGLSRLERVAPENEESAVRYLGSTIVLGDEACFCQFEGPTEAAVAEVNRRAGLPFDRIVPAVTVNVERRGSMEVSTPIPAPRRGRMLVVIGAVAVLAAVVTWAVLTFAVGSGSEAAQAVTPGGVATSLTPSEQSIGSYLFGKSAGLTPAQLQTIRNYQAGAAMPVTPAEQSIGSYLFGKSSGLTPAQLETVRNYQSGAAMPVTPAEQSIGSYLFGKSSGLTPAQLETVRNYQAGAR